jgi:very-short-patch-repair endonuclease
MKTLLVAVAVIAVILYALRKRAGREGADEATPPYYSKTPLTEPEKQLFNLLLQALPTHIVLAQVSMQALIGIRRNANDRTQRNRIDRKYVDFVICRKDFSVAAVIELDDSSHGRPDREDADKVKNIAFKTAGIPLMRFNVRNMPGVEEIRRAVEAG